MKEKLAKLRYQINGTPFKKIYAHACFKLNSDKVNVYK